ncbi:hypothetical protein BDN67DRAFT_975439 [Paxillus ammoniavirescens]|nr:hypothetical protein BDN67DRAFT_975439 [Paxillus ammoniavirescens]
MVGETVPELRRVDWNTAFVKTGFEKSYCTSPYQLQPCLDPPHILNLLVLQCTLLSTREKYTHPTTSSPRTCYDLVCDSSRQGSY